MAAVIAMVHRRPATRPTRLRRGPTGRRSPARRPASTRTSSATRARPALRQAYPRRDVRAARRGQAPRRPGRTCSTPTTTSGPTDRSGRPGPSRRSPPRAPGGPPPGAPPAGPAAGSVSRPGDRCVRQLHPTSTRPEAEGVMLVAADHASACARTARETMTDPTPTRSRPTASAAPPVPPPDPVLRRARRADRRGPDARRRGRPASPPRAAPARLARPDRSGGSAAAASRVRWSLVLAPVLAIVMFAGGVAVGSGPAPSRAARSSADRPRRGHRRAAPTSRSSRRPGRRSTDNYVDPKQPRRRGPWPTRAIRGMTEAVGDEGHTTFMTAEEAQAVDQSLSRLVRRHRRPGQRRATRTARSRSRTVFPNTPAEEAGLQRGDRIMAVDGETTEGETVDETVSPRPRPRGRARHAHDRPRRRARLRRHDHPPRVRPAARDVGDGPGHARSR